ARPPTARRNAPLDASVEFGQRRLQLRTGCDPELHEDLVQVVLGGSVTDEQPTPDVPVGQSVPGKTGDVDLLVGQLVDGLDGAHPHRLSRCCQFTCRAGGETGEATAGEYLVRGSKVGPGVHPALSAAEHLPVEQMSPRDHCRDPRAVETPEGFAVQAVRLVVWAQWCLRHGTYPQGPVVPDRSRDCGQPL